MRDAAKADQGVKPGRTERLCRHRIGTSAVEMVAEDGLGIAPAVPVAVVGAQQVRREHRRQGVNCHLVAVLVVRHPGKTSQGL